MYTLILKDSTPVPASLSVPEPRGDGREKAGVSWEAQFTASPTVAGEGMRDEERTTVFFPWREFKATFRGRPVEGLGEVERGRVKKVGVMMRSGFGRQEGVFGVVLGGIAAVSRGKGEGIGGGELAEL